MALYELSHYLVYNDRAVLDAAGPLLGVVVMATLTRSSSSSSLTRGEVSDNKSPDVDRSVSCDCEADRLLAARLGLQHEGRVCTATWLPPVNLTHICRSAVHTVSYIQ